MYEVFGIVLIALSMSSYQRQSWQIEMGKKLDSMIALSESHEKVIASTNMDRVQEAFEALGAFSVLHRSFGRHGSTASGQKHVYGPFV